MSHFFTKNRQAVQLKWQKKQTSANSQNDTFTIYAQVAHLSSQKPKTQLQMQIHKIEQSQVSHSQISKLRDTLRTLEHLSGQRETNNNMRRSHQFQLHTQELQNKKQYSQEKISYNKLFANESPYQGSINDFEQSNSYMSKLELMKSRLEKIAQNQQSKTLQIFQYNKNNSRQSTTRVKSKSYTQKSRNKKNNQTQINPNFNNQQNKGMYSEKNTVPLMRSHDEYQNQDKDYGYYRGSTNVDLSSYNNNKINQTNTKNKVKLSPNTDKYIRKNQKIQKINQDKNNYQQSGSIKRYLSKNGTKNIVQLYPSYSEQLDMKIYKQKSQLLNAKKQQNKASIGHLNQKISFGVDESNHSYKNQVNIGLSNQPTRRVQNNNQVLQKNNIYRKQRANTQNISATGTFKNINKQQNIKETNNKIAQKNNKNKRVQMQHIHRAQIIQMLFESSPRKTKFITASNDYKVQFNQIDKQTQTIKSQQIYRHRGAITSLNKINNILLTTGKDQYLKYYRLQQTNPISIGESHMYKFQSSPNQLTFINETNVVVNSDYKIWHFDINKNQPIKQISIERGCKAIQNGIKLYLGGTNSLSVIDFRCSNPIIKIKSSLPRVQNWIVHPVQQLFFINADSKIIQIDNKHDKNQNVWLSFATLPSSQSVVDYSWSSRSSLQLSILTQQQAASYNIINRIYQYSIKTRQCELFTFNQQKHLAGRVTNSLSIIRQFEQKYYLGDKNGTVHIYNNLAIKNSQKQSKGSKNSYVNSLIANSRANKSVP